MRLRHYSSLTALYVASFDREFLPTSNALVGLTANYYDNKDFTGTTAGRIDSQVNFDWNTGAPISGFGAYQFSTRWTGRVLADKTETYTFYTQNDDGVRLWVNGAQLINSWVDGGVTERSAKLFWSSPSLAKQIIPRDALVPAQ